MSRLRRYFGFMSAGLGLGIFGLGLQGLDNPLWVLPFAGAMFLLGVAASQ